jgi:hypothetical protein
MSNLSYREVISCSMAMCGRHWRRLGLSEARLKSELPACRETAPTEWLDGETANVI